MNRHRTDSAAEMETSFGFRGVEAGAKQAMVDEVFHRVAYRYDIMNDIMSAGMHRVWKDAMVAWLHPPQRRGWSALDIAGGTGDIAFRIVEASRKNADVTISDVNPSMLNEGRKRASDLGYEGLTHFIEANAEHLPFPDDAFDACTISFGIRNVPNIERALAEAFRVLKTGGRFMCLEFSEIELPLLDRLYDAWSFQVIPKMGKLVTGDEGSYKYLVESIRKFPNQSDFAETIRSAGFAKVTWRNYSGGIAACHSGWKL